MEEDPTSNGAVDNMAPRNFCQKPSQTCLELFDEFDDDPRSAFGAAALDDMLRLNQPGSGASDGRDANAPPISSTSDVVDTYMNVISGGK